MIHGARVAPKVFHPPNTKTVMLLSNSPFFSPLFRTGDHRSCAVVWFPNCRKPHSRQVFVWNILLHLLQFLSLFPAILSCSFIHHSFRLQKYICLRVSFFLLVFNFFSSHGDSYERKIKPKIKPKTCLNELFIRFENAITTGHSFSRSFWTQSRDG